MRLIREAFPRISLRKPVLSSEGDQRNIERVTINVGLEHDGDAVSSAAMPDEPAFKGSWQPYSRERVRGDLDQEDVDFIKAACCRSEVTLRCLDDMVDQRHQIALDQRMTDQTHQLA